MHRSTHGALCVGLQYGLPVGLFAVWTICRLTYPLKPSLPVSPGHIPFGAIGGRTCVKDRNPPTTFHETLRVPALRQVSWEHFLLFSCLTGCYVVIIYRILFSWVLVVVCIVAAL
jgi:hypothetical protein